MNKLRPVSGEIRRRQSTVKRHASWMRFRIRGSAEVLDLGIFGSAEVLDLDDAIPKTSYRLA
ncbi:hypothetical protein C1H46_024918 [Malus baccata]|uniref:Uncharacterized protein n=1 Tax=Malus baccata TaxID=106549 RepID=A0A540LT97_MALBA|nr:hypothetical protein C1H46_024918 [Malus baccata]